MLLKVVNQLDPLVLSEETVHRDFHLAHVIRGLQERNVVNRFPEAVVHLESSPIRGEAWREVEFVYLQPQTQQRFHDKPVRPASRPRVPRPSATTCVRR